MATPPRHSIDYCPICGGGLCGIRICGMTDDKPHGLIVCDECEAIWTEPDSTADHQYPDAEDACCPICKKPLWGPQSRWANWDDCSELGWIDAIDPQLDIRSDEGFV
jgi:hypothetical protein